MATLVTSPPSRSSPAQMFALPCEAPESAANGLAPVTRFLLRIPRSRNHPPRGVAWADTGWLPRVPCDCCHGTGAPPARRLQSPGAAGSAPRGVQVQPCVREARPGMKSGHCFSATFPDALQGVLGAVGRHGLPTRGSPGPGVGSGRSQALSPPCRAGPPGWHAAPPA